MNYDYSVNHVLRNWNEDGDKFFHFQNPEELADILHDLPQDASFDRIEIHSHGGSDGQLHDSRGENYLPTLLEGLGELDIAAPDATLVLLACNFEMTRPFQERTSTSAEALGRAILRRGGKVISTPRAIVTSRLLPVRNDATLARRVGHHALMAGTAGTLIALGVWPIIYLKEIIGSNPIRSLSGSRPEVYVTEIPSAVPSSAYSIPINAVLSCNEMFAI